MISFKFLEQYLSNSNITLVMTKNENIITVSLLPQPKINDKAKDNLKPLMIKGTAEELDAQFHIAIQKPLDLVSGVIDNISEFEKSVQKLKVENKAEEEAKKAKEKENAEKIKKGDKIVAKAKDLFDKKEYDKASKLLDDPLFTEITLSSAVDLKSRIKEVAPIQPDIFASVPPIENTVSDNKEEVVVEEKPIVIEEKLEVKNNDNIERVIPAIDFEKATEPVTLTEIAKESPNVIIASIPKEEVKTVTKEEIDDLYKNTQPLGGMFPNENFDDDLF